MIFENKKALLKNLVLHLEFEINTVSRAKKMADLWSAFFFPKLKTWRVSSEPSKLFHSKYLLAWDCLVRPIYVSKASPIERCWHNTVVSNIDAAKMSGTNVLFVPDIDDVVDDECWINSPKKYLPFLLSIKHPFKRVVFYSDAASCAFYTTENNILYINRSFNDECPMAVVHEAIARQFILPRANLNELRKYQQDGVAPIDGYAQNPEDRFVRDYVAHMLGHNPNVFLSANLRTLQEYLLGPLQLCR